MRLPASRARRGLAALVAVAALAGTTAVASGCGGSSVDPVAQAATATVQQHGVHLAMTISFVLPTNGQEISMPGSGVLDVPGKRADLTFDLSSLNAAAGGRLGSGSNAKLEEIVIFPELYLHAPFLTSSVPSHKPWVKFNVQTLAKRVTGFDPTQLTTTQSSPADQLQQLRASGSVHRVGTDVVRGVQTTHYRGVIDLHKVPGRLPPSQRQAAEQGVNRLIKLTGSSTYPFDVWIDSHRLVRRENIELTYKVGAGQPVTSRVSMDFFDYGPTPAIAPPPADQVFDATAQALNGA